MTFEEVAALPIEEHLRLACDAGTDQAILEWLYGHWQPHASNSLRGRPGIEGDAVRRVLAGNPSTPLSVLARLAGDFPAEFCTNPVTPLILLEAPDFAASLLGHHVDWLDWQYPQAVPGLLCLVRRGDLPPVVARGLLPEAERVPLEDVVEELCLHVAVSGEAGDDWREGVCAALREAATALEGADGQVLGALLAVGAPPPWLAPSLRCDDAPAHRTILRGALQRVATSGPLCRGVALMRLGDRLEGVSAEKVGCLHWVERLGIALNPNVSALPEVLASLTEDGNRYVRAAARARMRGEDVRM